MMKRKTGFTLVELLVVIAIMGLAMAASSDMFIRMLNMYKQQSKIAETNIEGMVGLELFRQDLERAGYGLPWVMNGVTYSEAAGVTQCTSPANGNDSPNPPRPIVTCNNADFPPNASDYLIIKAANITRNATSQRWTYLMTNVPQIKTWDQASENPANQDYVIVLSPGDTDLDERALVETGGIWSAKFQNIPGSAFIPTAGESQPRYVYDISDLTASPRMPFNRADYYITTTSVPVPQRCAPNTGVLVKSIISQSNGSRADFLPLLDCVANMQVIYRLDTNADGIIDLSTDDISALSALDIRREVKEIRVYILAHEGMKDDSYTYSAVDKIYVGDPTIGAGQLFDIGTNVHYRWKIYTIVVQPKNMRN